MRLFHHSAKRGHHPDYFLIVLVIILTAVGLVILASASSEIGKSKFNDSYYYLKHQLTNGLILGLIGGLAAIMLHYQTYRRLAFILLLLNLACLVLVFTPLGIQAGGANRWLRLGPVGFQPAELLKITYILYIAAWLTNPKVNRSQDVARGLMPFLVISGVVAGLVVMQPATSIVLILLASGAMIYFLSGAPLRHLFFMIMVGILAVSALLFASKMAWISPYRWQRIATYFDPSVNTNSQSYQINQALTAIGSGQTTGIGYGQSTTKVNRLPAPIDDSIFAVAAQELGFVGAAALISLFGMLVFRMLWIARRMRDRFGALILVGFGAIIALQSIVNMGAISGLFPLTGIPLPFVSYGGTALAVFLTMSGISINISRYS